MFNWEITFGNLLSIGSFAVACTVFVLMLRADIMVLAQRVHAMEDTLKLLAETTAKIGQQSATVEILHERLNMLSGRVDRIRNGH